MRVKLLSERLLAIQGSEGRYGLVDEFCAPRGVSLWFGRNEDCGVRCAYHGWKYDVTGQCVDVPSESEQSGFARKIKLASDQMVSRTLAQVRPWALMLLIATPEDYVADMLVALRA